MRMTHACLLGAFLVLLLPWQLPAVNERYVWRADFESVMPPALPGGWAQFDQNGDGTVWTTREQGGDRGGPCARFLADPANPSDDWLFTDAITLDAGTPYTLTFVTRNTTTTLPHTLEVWGGTGQSPAAATTLFLPATPFAEGVPTVFGIPLSVPASGDYFLGFRCLSPPGSHAIHLDTITVAREESALEFVLQMDKEFYEGSSVYTSDEAMDCLVWVKNTGSESIKVNPMMGVGFEADPAFVLSFEIIDPDSLVTESTARFEPAIPEEEDFVTLQPDEMFFKFYGLNVGIHSFTKTGDYTIRAVYRNVFPSAAGDAWLGRLVSTPVTITVNP